MSDERVQPERMKHEKQTIAMMVEMYCRDLHGGSLLCPECSAFLAYARQRLDRCPFQEAKPTCANCEIHCYKPAMREMAKAIMKYSGPRMSYRHPVMAFRHILDSHRRPARKPDKPGIPRTEEVKNEH